MGGVGHRGALAVGVTWGQGVWRGKWDIRLTLLAPHQVRLPEGTLHNRSNSWRS